MEQRMQSGKSIMMWCGIVLLVLGTWAGPASGG